MEGIYEPTSKFSFDKLTIHSPVATSGGNYFLRFLVDQSPLYLQMPKSTTKSGIITSNKKCYCDLQFTNENEELITWMEDLENFACKYIFENREKWFETEMELTDIENYFASPLKTYRSGRFYLARVNIPQRLGKIHLNIYDEHKQLVPIEQLNEQSEVLSVIEIQGIKCSARSFQIEMEVKQMMKIEQKNLFEQCVIPPMSSGHLEEPETLEKTDSFENNQMENMVTTFDESDQVNMDNQEEQVIVEDGSDLEDSTGNLEEFLEETSLGKEKDLEDFEIDLDAAILPEEDTVQIKERKDVFYELYREARKKAKIAKKMALDAYLEANNIKKTYELDSDSESEDEWMEEMAIAGE